MVSIRSASICCALSAVLDLLSSSAVLLAASPREAPQQPCTPSSAWAGLPFFVCSFWDLLPLAAARISALLLSLGLALLATRDWTKPRDDNPAPGGQSEPLLGGSDGREGGDDSEESLKATQRSEKIKQGWKVAATVLVYLVAVSSQVYIALKVGLFQDHSLFGRSPSADGLQSAASWVPLGLSIGQLPGWTIPLGLVLTVLAVNLEAVSFSAAVDAVWQPHSYVCRSLHLHPLSYDPAKVAWACKSCGKTLMQGFKVAFTCKKCNYNCCMACYRQKRAHESDSTRTPPKSAQEADVTTWQLAKLMLGLISTEIPLVVASLGCVLGATLVDNIIPDIQGRIFSDMYSVSSDRHLLGGLLLLATDPILSKFFKDLAVYLYCLLASMVLSAVRSQTFKLFGLRLTCKLQKQLFSRILGQRTDFFDDASVGDLSSRLSRELPGMLDPIDSILPDTISSAGGLLIGLFFCFKYSWKLSLCCFATIPPIIHISRVYAKWSSKLWMQQYVGWGAANHICNEAFTNIRTVHSFSTETHEEGKYNIQMDQMLKYGVRGALGSSGAAFINGCLSLTTNILVLGYGGYLVLFNSLGESDTGMDAGKLIAYQLYMNKMQAAFRTLQGQINSLTRATGAAQRVVGLMDSMPEEDSKQCMQLVPTGEVHYDDVRFSYKSRPEAQVLKGLTLLVPGGSVCGIVGTSGAGKSTVLSLLMQFYVPTSGKILVDGHDISQFDRRSIHKFMGIVTQETQVFASSIEENIAYGLEGYTRADLEWAAKQAHAHEFISAFPEGYSTMVGERGVKLSGGQRQRLALARLLIRKPKVVLLDEATSALDAESEAAVQEALDALMLAGGRTVIVVAHRLSTVKNADSIAVMDEGTVAEQGKHQELVSRAGIYARLVRRQLEGLSSSQDIDAVPGDAP